MRSWTRPAIPELPGTGILPTVFDSATGVERPTKPNWVASLYVCGITPYDATHLGHAATYLAYDTLVRLWLDAGYDVDYVQNVTDVDDPLLERAAATGVDWRELAASQTELFRHDMEQLRIVPPTHYVAVSEVIEPIAGAVRELLDRGIAYTVDSADAAPRHLLRHRPRRRALAVVPRPAKRPGPRHDARPRGTARRGSGPAGQARPAGSAAVAGRTAGEPAWDSAVGRGRPGWHIECAVIGLKYLRSPITVNGGGNDLIFPHHEFSASHAAALTGPIWSDIYSHAGLIAYQGEKMSKSLGEPRVRLAAHRRRGRPAGDPARAARDALPHRVGVDGRASGAGRRSGWMPGDAWATDAGQESAATESEFLHSLREILANDLDTPGAIAAIDARIAMPAPRRRPDVVRRDRRTVGHPAGLSARARWRTAATVSACVPFEDARLRGLPQGTWVGAGQSFGAPGGIVGGGAGGAGAPSPLPSPRLRR